MPSITASPQATSTETGSITLPRLAWVILVVAALPVLALLIWQGVTAEGNPDPLAPKISHFSAILDISVLVFREGLESILVLAAITAGLSRNQAQTGRSTPIFLGACAGFLATLLTWCIVRGIVQDISKKVSYLNLQAFTGLVAVVVLLIVMNWFLHKIYWGGWITIHNRQKKRLFTAAEQGTAPELVFWGLVLLGLSSVYREGFEVVLFLQSYYLKLGGLAVLYGSLIGLALTLIVAAITFIAHGRMPYRKMLIVTGILLGFVLLVMVGEEAYEMQQAQWISTTTIEALTPWVPDWAGIWFSLYPTVETLVAQALAGALVIGSYYAAGSWGKFANADESETTDSV